MMALPATIPREQMMGKATLRARGVLEPELAGFERR